MKILVTGAAGYIGSHVLVQLLGRGFEVVAVDNHSNSRPDVYAAVRALAGRDFACHRVDVTDAAALAACLAGQRIEACLHFAAFKAVGESGQQPQRYFDNNVGGLLALTRVLAGLGTRHFVFSSSATVYGAPDRLPVAEDAALRPASVYAQTKLMGEQVLQSLAAAAPFMGTAILRYFNPVGAHPSALIGEEPLGTPNNLMPLVAQVAAGLRPMLQVFGQDYATPDGTCIRDYLHVEDLARGHLAALDRLLAGAPGFTVNLGTGRGHSVLEVLSCFEETTGMPVAHRFAPRRAGDVACYYADASLARQLLGWTAQHDLAAMCRDAWRWQQACASRGG